MNATNHPTNQKWWQEVPSSVFAQVGPPFAQGTCPGAGIPEVGPVGPCALALTPLGVSSVPLGTLVFSNLAL